MFVKDRNRAAFVLALFSSMLFAMDADAATVTVPITFTVPDGQTGPQGPKGDAGPQGPQGVAGKDGVSPTIDVNALAKQVATLLASSSSASSSSSSSSSSGASSSSSSVSSASSSSSSSIATSGGVTVNTANAGATVIADTFGSNLWTVSSLGSKTPSLLNSIGTKLVRWPGGSKADIYHWKNHTECDRAGGTNQGLTGVTGPNPAYDHPSTFDWLRNSILTPGNFELAVAVDYGSNAACNGGGDPSEAAAWVAYAKANNVKSKYWTVGNEVFGGWEFDLHAKPNDALTYAHAVGDANGFYDQMKAADPNARVCIVLEGNGLNYWDGWDKNVLATIPASKYDCVDAHWYAQQPGSESDAYIVKTAAGDFTKFIANLRAVIKPGAEVIVTEINSVAYNPGKQTASITNALFAAQMYGEAIADNVNAMVWWFGYGGTQNCGNNNAASLYGWQIWGSYDQIAWNTAYTYNTCTNNNGGPIVPQDAVLPQGNAAKLAAQFATPGEHLLEINADPSAGVKAYAATQGAGYSLMLINTDNVDKSVPVSIPSLTTSMNATQATYGRKQYDDSSKNIWTSPQSQSLGTVKGTFNVTLPAWSINVITLN